MTILAFIFWVVLALFASGVVIHRKDTQPKNKVHFYVARDKDESLWLYLGKPIRNKEDNTYRECMRGRAISSAKYFELVGLNIDDYKNLKWEDEPIEVFLNLED